MHTDLWGSCKGILIVCLLYQSSEQRSLNVAASSCGRGHFRNAPRVDADIFYTDKKDQFLIISGYELTRPELVMERRRLIGQLSSIRICSLLIFY